MKTNWTDSKACKNHVELQYSTCLFCRTNGRWQDAQEAAGFQNPREATCPEGFKLWETPLPIELSRQQQAVLKPKHVHKTPPTVHLDATGKPVPQTVQAEQKTPIKPAKPITPAEPAVGPGTELKKIFSSLGVAACQACNDLAGKMNAWGIEGCRQHRDEIIADIKNRALRVSLQETIQLGVKLAAAGLPLTIAGLVDEAIQRAAPLTPKTN